MPAAKISVIAFARQLSTGLAITSIYVKTAQNVIETLLKSTISQQIVYFDPEYSGLIFNRGSHITVIFELEAVLTNSALYLYGG